ncbi:MAG: ABC transporter substrate-binding protein [Phycisphaerae bacterium]|jgi:ABC-type branched-subunit amino acid transport system substrate-binding protein|nr:ABC transporter substrate-binding protein [Phycisphaerae bacterium]
MRIAETVFCIAIISVVSGCVESGLPGAGAAVDPDMRDVIDKINSVGPYEVPQLKLKRTRTYAQGAREVEPFRHVKPYKTHFLRQMEYTGPARAIPEPKNVKSVKIGFIGPIESTVSVATGGKSHEEILGRKMLQGARLAIEQANARGGYLKRKIPFELVISNDNGLWGASGNEIIKMAYKDKVWAIMGTIDGANTHIAIRVALKAEVPMMNSGDSDPTLVETNIPWIARCVGDDRKQGYLLVSYLYRKLGFKRVGIIRASNRYGRFGVREIIDGSRRMGNPIPLEMAYEVGGEDFSLQLDRLKRANVEAIVHWGDAADGANILNQMRKMGMKHPYFACDRCVSDEFAKIAGANASGVICTYPWNPNRKDKKLDAFRAAFGKRFSEAPETYACHAYDGMNMVLWAVQTAGLNRAKIRDVLAHRGKPWPGVTGDIPLSAVLDDMGEVFLAKRENNKWKYYSRKDLRIPPAETASSADTKEVRIGYFGPSDPKDRLGGDMWLAAQWAVEQANAAGGYQGTPFKLMPAWSSNPWSNGAKNLFDLVYKQRVRAIIGGIDGPSTHLAEQVVAKARLTLISPVSSDPTTNFVNVPWMFSAVPGDNLTAGPLVSEILRRTGGDGLVILSADDHDSRIFTLELRKALKKRRVGVQRQFEFRRGSKQTDELIANVIEMRPKALVIAAGPDDSARLVRRFRAQEYDGEVFGCAAMGRRIFDLKAAGGAVFPLLYDPSSGSKSAADFSKTFACKFGHSPDYTAAYTYDSVRILIAAIRKAGLNRAAIRAAVAGLSPWTGVTGSVRWDSVQSNAQVPPLGTVKNRRLIALPRLPVQAASIRR